MFSFITRTWNPVVGCQHYCSYCWARKLAETKLKNTERYKAGFKPRLIEKELARRFKPGEFVFVCDMGDLFGDWVPDSWILKVFEAIEHNSESQFLLLTKNPKRYLQFEDEIPWNCICGATIETNRAFATWLSYAPEPYERWKAMRDLDWGYKFICMEPIMDFDLPVMFNWIASIAPDLWGVAIGYDNYNNNLPEPPLAKTKRLIELLKKLNYHFQLEIKTLREGE